MIPYKPGEPLTFEEFVARAMPRDRDHVVAPEYGLHIYIRAQGPSSITRPEGVDFDLATIDAAVPGSGGLTRFLDHYEPRYGFFVENVLNERLAAFLERRGYLWHTSSGRYSPSYYRPRGPCDTSPKKTPSAGGCPAG